MKSAEEQAADLVRLICRGLREETFAFAVQVLGTKYDVYHVTINGIDGMVAFCMTGEEAHIVMCRSGKFTPDEVSSYISRNTQ